MKKYTEPNISISYFNHDNIIIVSGTGDEATAGIKEYANKSSVRLKQVEYDVLKFSE